MYFEGREVRDYAEPVSASDLREGEVYFAINYVDDDMLIPVMETIVFIGRNLEADDVGNVYFQDVQSYREGIRYGLDQECEWAKFDVGSENEVNHIFNYEQALDALIRCSVKRRHAGMG
jgi:hypothetical protein